MRAIEQDNLTTRPVDKVEKIKTPFAQVIVGGPIEKPYYSIMWWDVTDQLYNIGYSSYNLEFVFEWLRECFEVDDNMKKPHVLTLDDLRPKGRWIMKETMIRSPFAKNAYCSECNEETSFLHGFCLSCGADMRGGGEDG